MSANHGKYTQEQVLAVWSRHGGNISATSREMGIARSTVQEHIRKSGLGKKPLVGGDRLGTLVKKAHLPAKGLVRRYILTAAQNNTHVNVPFWNALTALAEHYEAEIMVGTFSYNTNAYGELAVKQGKKHDEVLKLWFDPLIKDHINDNRVEIADGLVWCGEMNILPTAEDPLSGLETYSHRKSAIFPHTKVAMRSIPTMQGEGTKLNYTTGAVTLKNYIQKKAGLKAEHHHRYAALVVEVDHTGYWCVRQIGLSNKGGCLQDLDVVVTPDGKVTSGNPVEAITWGDLHATIVDSSCLKLSLEVLEQLKPKTQFMHDVLEGVAINHHTMKDPHQRFRDHLRGLGKLSEELRETLSVLGRYEREWCHTVVVDSNHDSAWLLRWLREYDYRQDPSNAVLFLEAQLAVYRAIEEGDERFHPLEWALKKYGCGPRIQFLRTDESFMICGRKIECGMHGHLGPNGSKGAPNNLKRVGRRANTAHTHAAGIYDGLYVAGTSSKLKWSYSKGPTAWTHSHIITYPNGMRSILTMYSGKWRA